MKIKLRLEGAFQAWGVPSEYVLRNTSNMPTARGVVGLIGCCMGISRGDSKLEVLQNVLNITFSTEKVGRILRDFQTVSKSDGSDLDKASDSGDKKKNIVIYKSYINDASFIAHIEGPDDIVMKIYKALLDPVWVPYLGRKNCSPTEPLIPEIEE